MPPNAFTKCLECLTEFEHAKPPARLVPIRFGELFRRERLIFLQIGMGNGDFEFGKLWQC